VLVQKAPPPPRHVLCERVAPNPPPFFRSLSASRNPPREKIEVIHLVSVMQNTYGRRQMLYNMYGTLY
jgi:hypothetical protein